MAVNTSRLHIAELAALNRSMVAAKSLKVRVGILGEHVDRGVDAKGHTKPRANRFDANWNKEKITNPQLGAVHEFGSISMKIPKRSFLRMPLITKLPGEIEKIGKRVWARLIVKNGIVPALKQLGVLGENVVQQAFNTGGFGSWAPNKPSTIRRKGSSAILIDSAQLRKSVTSAVTASASNKLT